MRNLLTRTAAAKLSSGATSAAEHDDAAGLRICDVNNHFCRTGGGVRRYHEEKLHYYRGRPELRYALIEPSNRFAKRADANITIYEVPALPLGASGYRFIHRGHALRSVFEDFRPDVVEIGSALRLPAMVRKQLDSRRTAVVGFYHSNYPDSVVRPLARRIGPVAECVGRHLARLHACRTYSRLDATVGASEYVVGELGDLGIRNTIHVPLGVDTKVFHPAKRNDLTRRRWGARKDDVVIGFVGRFAQEKGIDLLAGAISRLQSASHRFVFILAGKGPRARDVRALARRHSRVQVEEYLCGEEEVARTMASFDISLSLGATETFSLTTIEALACGTPVVAPDSGGAGELVRRSGVGSVFRPGDAWALGHVLLALAGRTDEVTRRRARRFSVRNYSWDATFTSLTAVYAHAARSRGWESRAGHDLLP